MKITKYGHACLLIEEGGARILIDPGVLSGEIEVAHLDAILVTHNHQDHLDTTLIAGILTKNPKAKVITVAEAAKNLSDADIRSTQIEDGGEFTVAGVSIRSFGKQHAFIWGDIPQCQNTGFMIANRFYHPGDSFHVPAEPVEILALPVGGPWMKLAEAIDYAKEVKPRFAIPMHDAFLQPEERKMFRSFPKMVLEKDGIDFRSLEDGESTEV